MEIEKAEIVFIGKIATSKTGRKSVLVKMKMPITTEVKDFVVLQSRNSRFDLIKLFEREGHFKVGQKVGFEYNKAQEDWQHDSIWKLKIREE